MVIVKDIQDALTMKNLIEDVIRRADNCSKEHVLIELDMICATLQKNVNLTESEMEIEAQIEAKKITADIKKLTQVCRVLMGNGVENMTSPELKRDLLVYAKHNPEDFLDTINDPMLELMDDVHQFFNATLLTFRNNGKDVYYNLPNNKKKMMTVPFGEDPHFIVGSFMQSDEGLEVYKLLKNKIK